MSLQKIIQVCEAHIPESFTDAKGDLVRLKNSLSYTAPERLSSFWRKFWKEFVIIHVIPNDDEPWVKPIKEVWKKEIINFNKKQ